MIWRRRRALADLDEDIRDHLARETEENIARGMSREEADVAARRAFGSVSRNRPGEIASRCAVARIRDQPGLSRPIAARNQLSFRSRLLSRFVYGSAHSGTATSNVRPTSTPKKSAGVTPTISYG